MRENAERFDGLAEAYAAFRPGYPAQAFAEIAAGVQAPLKRALDVAAGPGNSTLALRAALGPDWSIAAAEPGRDMRRVLSRRLAGSGGVVILDACAEALPLPPGFAALATICTAWHWLDAGRTMAEMARVLAPGGVLAVLRNRRLPHPALDAIEAYFEAQSPQDEDTRRREARALPPLDYLAAQPGFGAPQAGLWPWAEEVDTRRLIDLFLTRSSAWALVRRIGLDRVLQDLGEICTTHLPEGRMVLGWQTQAHWVQRL